MWFIGMYKGNDHLYNDSIQKSWDVIILSLPFDLAFLCGDLILGDSLSLFTLAYPISLANLAEKK